MLRLTKLKTKPHSTTRQIRRKIFIPMNRSKLSRLKAMRTVGDIEDLKWTEGLFSIVTGIPVRNALRGTRNRDEHERHPRAGRRLSACDWRHQRDDGRGVPLDIRHCAPAGWHQPGFSRLIFNWGAKDREDTDRKIVRGERMLRMGFSFRTVMHTVDIDGVTYEEEVERIKEQIAENVIPYKGVLVGGIRATGEGIIATSDKDAANEEDRIDLTNLFDANGNGNGIHPSD